jgi:hypothetical protein
MSYIESEHIGWLGRPETSFAANPDWLVNAVYLASRGPRTRLWYSSRGFNGFGALPKTI